MFLDSHGGAIDYDDERKNLNDVALVKDQRIDAASAATSSSAWPSYADGRATTRALLRGTPDFRVWQEENPGSRERLLFTQLHQLEAGASIMGDKIKSSVKTIRAAANARAGESKQHHYCDNLNMCTCVCVGYETFAL